MTRRPAATPPSLDKLAELPLLGQYLTPEQARERLYRLETARMVLLAVIAEDARRHGYPHPAPLLSLPEVAKRLGVSKFYVVQLLRESLLPLAHPGDKTYQPMVRADDVQALAESFRPRPAAEVP